MASSRVTGVRLAGIASAVPEQTRAVADDVGPENADRVSQALGVKRRHVVSGGLCASDLCYAAAERLLEELRWPRDTVDLLIFVSQTPDYRLPATSCTLQARLGLPTSCAAFDVGLGCSGYVYGFWLAAHLIAGGGVRRALLLAGDTISQVVSPHDRSVAPLFGDAGSATALERSEEGLSMFFELGTDGSGWDHLIVPAGGFRQPATEANGERTEREPGNLRSDQDLAMNGPEIFAFTLREVPPLIHSVLAQAGWSTEEVDAFLLHQANGFVLNHLRKRLRVPAEKMVVAMEEYGNTSVTSIPLAATHALAEPLRSQPRRLVLAGFGVGFSWGAAALTAGPMQMPELVVVSAPAPGESQWGEGA